MSACVFRRVDESFKDQDPDSIVKSLEFMRDSLLGYSTGLRRSTSYILLFAAIFELLANANLTEFTLGPAKLSHPAPLLVFLPPIVAYFFMEAGVYTHKYGELRLAFRQLYYLWNVKAGENHLLTLIMPREPLFWTTFLSEAERESKHRWLVGFRNSVSVGVILAGVIGFIVFEIHALIILSRASGTSDILLRIIFITVCVETMLGIIQLTLGPLSYSLLSN